MDTFKIRITFTEPLLGAVPKDPDVYASYIATQAALTDEAIAEELATVEAIEEKGWTGFHMLDGTPILYDYVIKGFFKDACGMLRRVPGTKSAGAAMKAYKKIIDGLVFVTPRQIVLEPSGDCYLMERPLRAQTAQGERVTLARSDAYPAGTAFTFVVTLLGGADEATLREWLDYGALRGFGQWRNGGYGRFSYSIE